MKNTVFVEINDGSAVRNLQVLIGKDANIKMGYGASVAASGILSKTPSGQLELKADSFTVIGKHILFVNVIFI